VSSLACLSLSCASRTCDLNEAERFLECELSRDPGRDDEFEPDLDLDKACDIDERVSGIESLENSWGIAAEEADTVRSVARELELSATVLILSVDRESTKDARDVFAEEDNLVSRDSGSTNGVS
jgi:hypothetical protein